MTARTPEQREAISKARRAAAHRIADEWERMGPPETKRCTNSRCESQGKPLPIEMFPLKTRRWADGRTVKYPHSQCRDCLNLAKRERRDKLKKEDPEELKRREKAYRESYKDKDREAFREYQRIWSDGQRRKAGVTPRNWNGGKRAPDKVREYVPCTDEFREWLYSQNMQGIERALDQARGTIHHFACGERKTLTLDLAERILRYVNDGKTLDDFWPLESDVCV